VGLASGKWDALLYILGLCLGVVVAGELWDLIEPIMSIGSMGRVTLFEFFGVSSWLIGAVVIVIAVAGTRFANWFEQRSRGKNV